MAWKRPVCVCDNDAPLSYLLTPVQITSTSQTAVNFRTTGQIWTKVRQAWKILKEHVDPQDILELVKDVYEILTNKKPDQKQDNEKQDEDADNGDAIQWNLDEFDPYVEVEDLPVKAENFGDPEIDYGVTSWNLDEIDPYCGAVVSKVEVAENVEELEINDTTNKCKLGEVHADAFGGGELTQVLVDEDVQIDCATIKWKVGAFAMIAAWLLSFLDTIDPEFPRGRYSHYTARLDRIVVRHSEGATWASAGVPPSVIDIESSLGNAGMLDVFSIRVANQHLLEANSPAILVVIEAPHIFLTSRGEWRCLMATCSGARMGGQIQRLPNSGRLPNRTINIAQDNLFIVIGSDALFENLSAEDVVRIVSINLQDAAHNLFRAAWVANPQRRQEIDAMVYQF